MAQLVIAAAGAAIGGYLVPGVVALGLTGAQIGYFAGSLLASSFAPTQKNQGPRLDDLKVSGSAFGTPIPYLDGAPRAAGQNIWASDRLPIATVTEQGKGGGGSETTTYTYTVNLLILLSENQMEGISRTWSSGKLVYIRLASATDESVAASDSTTLWSRLTFYDGNASQLPDPTYEAAVGTPDALAYRGRSTVFIEGLQLGSSGQIPNLTFEIYSESVVSAPELVYRGQALRTTTGGALGSAVYGDYCYVGSYGSGQIETFDVSDPTAPVSVHVLAVPTNPGDMVVLGAYLYVTYTFTSQMQVYSLADPAAPAYAGAVVLGTGCLGLAARGNYIYVPARLDGVMKLHVVDVSTPSTPTVVGISDTLGSSWVETHIALSSEYPNHAWVVASTAGDGEMNVVDISNPSAPFVVQTLAINTGPYSLTIQGDYAYVGYLSETFIEVFDISTPASTFSTDGISAGDVETMAMLDGLLFGVTTNVGVLNMWDVTLWPTPPSILQSIFDIGTRVFNISAAGSYLYVLRSGLTSETRTLTVYELVGLPTITYPTIQEVVTALLLRAGMTADQFDVTELASITQPVRAMAITQVSTVRQVLEMLAGAYFFEVVASDKLYFRPRGGSAVRTLSYEDIGWGSDGADARDPLVLNTTNELEIPAQVALTYNNMDGDYQTDTQYSDRLLSSMKSTSAISLPLGMTASEAKKVSDAMLVDGVVAALSTTIVVGLEHADLEPTDVVIVTGEDGSTYRMRIMQRSDAGSTAELQCVLDDASALTQAGITDGATESQTVVAALPDTTLELLDIPLLRDANDGPGYYLAVSGGGSSLWRAAGIYDSADGTSYTLQKTVDSQAVIGLTTTALTTWSGGNVWDEVSTVTVEVDGELSSSTAELVIALRSTNAAVIGSELVQYRTATLVSPGVYTLSGFLRGRRGTEWAMSGHSIGERFVLLGNAGLRYMALQTGELGALRYVKAVSAGQLLSAITADTITPLGVSLKPLAPVLASADRSGADTILSWYRRTRLSTRITGPLVWSNPLGEATEAYEIDVYADGTYAAVVRTITASDSQATYTAANQTTDFGSPPATLYLDIYQISATVGRGTALRAAV